MNENGGPEAVFMILWTVDQYYQKKKRLSLTYALQPSSMHGRSRDTGR